jgi:hypothetical protein
MLYICIYSLRHIILSSSMESCYCPWLSARELTSNRTTTYTYMLLCKQCYTRVLKGHIALSTVVFPVGTTGHTLDILARVPLWQAGLDYRHGTGHGVGAYLNVHEVMHLKPHLALDARSNPTLPLMRADVISDIYWRAQYAVCKSNMNHAVAYASSIMRLVSKFEEMHIENTHT